MIFGCCKKPLVIDAIAPKQVCPVAQSKEKVLAWTEKEMNSINHIADTLVQNNIISNEEAKTQVTAINDFFTGKMSYAEMRAIAG